LVPNHVVFGKYQELGLINVFGEHLLDPVYKQIIPLHTNPTIIGVRNHQGKVAIMALDANKIRRISEFEFSFARVEQGIIKVAKGNQFATVSINGEIT